MKNYYDKLSHLNQLSLNRKLVTTQHNNSPYCQFDNQTLLNLSSNDYLGINGDKLLKQQFLSSLDDDIFFASSSSSRLLTGNTPYYEKIEQLLAKLYQKHGSILFNSGYHANIGILPALAGKKDLILADKLCHASLIDGIRLSHAKHLRFKHNDYQHLESILEKYHDHYENIFIVTESIFSMNGDCANLNKLVHLKKKYNALLYVDEAHTVGCYGQNGLGLSEQTKTLDDIDIIVCPMGKAIASIGAYAVLNNPLYDLLINRARSLIFSTALPEINLKWSYFILSQLDKFSKQRTQLNHLIAIVDNQLNQHKIKTYNSHIIPIVVGENQKALNLANYLKQNGILAFAIRPPTVPKNTARVRLSLTANIKEKTLLNCIYLVKKYLHNNL